ncbi:PREDICTED: atherin-like, partial [Chinchilla lanigera]|uniref:atherin-like n=1 Tax=Chinchilla lanigera TaxID=34839 RepID=UPI0006976F08
FLPRPPLRFSALNSGTAPLRTGLRSHSQRLAAQRTKTKPRWGLGPPSRTTVPWSRRDSTTAAASTAFTSKTINPIATAVSEGRRASASRARCRPVRVAPAPEPGPEPAPRTERNSGPLGEGGGRCRSGGRAGMTSPVAVETRRPPSVNADKQPAPAAPPCFPLRSLRPCFPLSLRTGGHPRPPTDARQRRRGPAPEEPLARSLSRGCHGRASGRAECGAQTPRLREDALTATAERGPGARGVGEGS